MIILIDTDMPLLLNWVQAVHLQRSACTSVTDLGPAVVVAKITLKGTCFTVNP